MPITKQLLSEPLTIRSLDPNVVCRGVIARIFHREEILARAPPLWPGFGFGTMRSGTDVICTSSRILFNELNSHKLPKPYAFTHRFSTEISPPAQTWIRTVVKPQHLFGDVSRLKDGFMEDLLSERVTPVPGTDFIASGFSCKDISEMNMYSALSSGCIAAGSLRSGGTFAGTMDYVDIVRPPVVLLENVAAIEQEDKSGDSNGQQVLRALRIRGYATKMGRECATFAALPQRRWRVWFVGLKVSETSVEGMESYYQTKLFDKFDQVH